MEIEADHFLTSYEYDSSCREQFQLVWCSNANTYTAAVVDLETMSQDCLQTGLSYIVLTVTVRHCFVSNMVISLKRYLKGTLYLWCYHQQSFVYPQ